MDLHEGKKVNPVADQTPDVPVVIGYKGAGANTANGNVGLNQKPYSGYNHAVNIDATPFVNRRTFHDYPLGVNSRGYSRNFHQKPSIIPSTGTSFNGYRPSSNSLFNSRVDVLRNPLPPIAVSVATAQDLYPLQMMFNNNGTLVRVPYFEQTFHRHYYGEDPPPQHFWYPKISSTTSKVEFKTSKPVWYPSQPLQNPHREGSHKTVYVNGEQETCYCGGNMRGLNWYPSTRTVTNDPGSQINDKLAPLN